MTTKQARHILIATIGLFFLAGFTGQEKYVELEGYLNGRSSAKFRAGDDNVKTVLATGTRGEILESKKMPSGNYALRVRPLSGSQKGQDVWIYYNVHHPDVKLYADAPKTWGPNADLRSPPTLNVPQAKGAETVRETQAILDSPGAAKPSANTDVPTPAPAPVSADGDTQANDLMNKIAQANQQVHDVGAAPTAQQTQCAECLAHAKAEAPQMSPDYFPPAPTLDKPSHGLCEQPTGNSYAGGGWRQAQSSIYFLPKVQEYCATDVPCKAFKTVVAMQGSGSLPGNRVLKYSGEIKPMGSCKTTKGAAGLCLTPFISIAADAGSYQMNDIIAMPSMKGKRIQMPDGSVMIHPGYFIVQDTGVAITGRNRFDFFTGSFGTKHKENSFVTNGLADPGTRLRNACATDKRFKVINQSSPEYRQALAAINQAAHTHVVENN